MTRRCFDLEATMTSLTRSRRITLAVAAAVLTSLSTAATGNAVAAPQLSATFSDDFNGPAGAAADGSKWQYETGDNVNNHEREWYTSGAANAALDGQGHLVITAKKEGGHNCWYGPCQYTSARLNTSGKFTAQYGHVEARMQIPRGQGMWPAFWLLGTNIGSVGWPNCGEIDVMENVGFEPNTVHGTIHGPGYSGSGGIGAGYSGPVFADGFHTYAIDWAPNSIKWSVDGHVYQTRTPADLGGKSWAFNHGFFIILNLAVGGYWPGDPNGSTPFPAKLVVDYVHVS
jgi:beta-glucanase (GH16 family)